jgi:V8-like Glu-specific endopeptidase
VPGQPDQVDQPAVTVPPRRTDQADRQDPTDLRDEAVPAGAAPARVPRSFAVPAASAEPGGPGTSPERLAAPAPRRLAAAGAEARGATSASPSTGAPYRGAGEVIKAVGRLYFTLSGVDYVCSATSISSANRDLLVTAGHCIHGGGQGQAFATNVSFAPGYVAGALHYGLWTARRLIAPQSWTASQDFNHDVGFVVLNTRNGQHLADVVGTERIAFDTPRSWPLYVFGYPAQPPYNGGTLVYCSGTPGRDPYGGTQDSMACSMTSGASGGPWLAKFGSTRPGGGYVVSVISYAYEGDPNHLYGPYFDTIIGMVWFKAQAA